MLDCKQVPCYLRKNLPATCHLRWSVFYSALLVIARRVEYTAWQSTPTRFLPENLVIAMKCAGTSCHSRWNVVTEAISSQAALVSGLLRYARNDKNQDRHTAFAMTIRTTLVMTKARWPRRLKRLLAMTSLTAFAMTTY